MSRQLSVGTLDHLATVARLKLPEDRYAPVTEAVELVMGLTDSLDDIELGETVPATAFNAQWE